MKNQTLAYHLLPTDDASSLYIDTTVNELLLDNKSKVYPAGLNALVNQHLYLTSDSTIKVGDWVYTNGEVWEYTKNEAEQNVLSELDKKIEFTTDPKLIADEVPAIDGNTKVVTEIDHPSHFGGTFKNNVKVNFLTEFCKRWNEKDNKQCKEFEAHKFAMENFNICPYCKKDNQNIVIECEIYYMPEGRLKQLQPHIKLDKSGQPILTFK